MKPFGDIQIDPYEYREEVSPISILKPKQSEPETAAQLAAEHARAAQEYQTRRASVIERGRQRAAELLALEQEVAKERQEHESLVQSLDA